MLKKLIDIIKYIFMSIIFGTDRTYNKTINVGSIDATRKSDIVEARNLDETPKEEKGNSF